MANVFQTLGELLEDIFTSHIPNDKLDKVLANQETMKADLLSIKFFLGVPDIRIGATPEQLSALAGRIKQQTDAVAGFDNSITPPPLPPQV